MRGVCFPLILSERQEISFLNSGEIKWNLNKQKNLAHSILHTRRMRPVNTWPFCDCAVTGVCAPFILINMTFFFNVLLLLLRYTYTSRTRTNLRYIHTHTHNRLVSCLLFFRFLSNFRGETNEKFVKFWILGKFLSDFWGSWFFYARNKIKLLSFIGFCCCDRYACVCVFFLL